MKVGDLVRWVRGIGLVVEDSDDHSLVLFPDNERFWLRKNTMELVNSALSDEQLENVIGGVSPQRFSDWRAEYINESR